ncbi:hypothetical protein CCUS01_04580, partial [Colletotrichum cuscutae]
VTSHQQSRPADRLRNQFVSSLRSRRRRLLLHACGYEYLHNFDPTGDALRSPRIRGSHRFDHTIHTTQTNNVLLHPANSAAVDACDI